VLDKNAKEAFFRDDKGVPTLEVHSVRPARRIGPDNQTVTELVVEMTQRRHGYYETKDQREADRSGKQRRHGYYETKDQREADRSGKKINTSDFIFRGGCTLLIDLDTARVRYCIIKRIRSSNRLKRMRSFLTGDEDLSLGADYFGDPRKMYFQGLNAKPGSQEEVNSTEPFALLHRSFEGKEVM